MRKTVVPLAAQAGDVLPQVRPACGSRPVVGSSRKTQRRVVDEAHRDVEAPPLAAGHRTWAIRVHRPVEVELRRSSSAPRGVARRPAHPVEHPVVDDLVAGPGDASKALPAWET